MVDHGNSKNLNMLKAKKVKNDEFYTFYEDIEKEVFCYQEQLAENIIYCNCDDPKKSAFWKFLHQNFTKLQLKKIVATYYNAGKETAYKYEYSGGNDEDYLEYRKIPIEGDGDFRSKDCLELLDECDISITNPPFSLYDSLVEILMKYGKKFLIIGNKNSVINKHIFPFIKAGKIIYGYHDVEEFLQPDGTTKKFGNIGWFTNLGKKKDTKKLNLSCRYYEADGITQKKDVEYPKYENYPAIEVNRVKRIPVDYKGVMGVPMTFLEYYDPDEYELIGHGKENESNQAGIQPVGKAFLNDFFMQGGKGHYSEAMRILCFYDGNGKARFPFTRLLIRKI